MDLIVDGKNVLEPVNLEKNKNEIMQQRASMPSQVSLTHFKENIGVFRANVKGDDMNNLVTELQKTFSDINTRESKMYDQLDTVFKTVESIHKGSIEGVIVGVKSAQEAISQAEYAINIITDTLTILQNFKSQLEDNTEHLNDIDIIWDATQQLDKDIQCLEDTLINRAKNIEADVKVLKELKSTLDKIKHLKDVDTLHSDFTQLKKSVEINKTSIDEEVSQINAGLKEISDFKYNLEKLEHLFDIDGLWSANDKLSSNVAELEKSMADDNQKIQRLDKSVQKNEEDIAELKGEMDKCRELDDEVGVLKNKVKMLYYALGGTIGIIVLQIILNVVGVL